MSLSGPSALPLIISIDLDSDPSRPASAAAISAGHVLGQHLQTYGLAASWVAGSGAPPVWSRIFTSRIAAASHELALLVDLDRSHQTIRFEQQLQQAACQFQNHHTSLQSVALRSGQVPRAKEVCALLERYGVRAIRMPPDQRTSGGMRAVRPELLRYGLVGLPVSTVLPPARRWSWRSPADAFRRQVRAQGQQALPLHLIIDLATSGSRSPSGGLRKLFSRIAEERDAGRVEVLTLGQFAGRWLQRNSKSGTGRSILRAA